MIKKLIIIILCTAVCLTISSCGKKTPSDEGRIESDSRLELERNYSFQNRRGSGTAGVILYENNRFSMGFSTQSSYLGFGSYNVDGDKLLLSTDDGEYHYTFTITEEGLVFDAENSSEWIWYADFRDGSLFQ